MPGSDKKPLSSPQSSLLGELRVLVERLERPVPRRRTVIPFGVAAIDRHLGSGLPGNSLHEAAGDAATLFIAGVLARLRGPVLWVLEQPDLFAPGLAGVGLAPDRVIYAEAGRPDAVLLAMEEGLRHPGLAGVVGEVSGRLTLTASRRLQLAAETSGVPGFVLRRGFRPQFLAEPNAAVTRWRLTALPSLPPFPDAPDVPGLGRARWRLELARYRGGESASWIVEACDAKGRLRLAADVADRPAAQSGQRIAG
jgi:protein ImuA